MSEYWTASRFGRRTVMRGTALAFTGVAGAALLGCSADDAEDAGDTGDGDPASGATGTASTGTATASDEPRRGGILKHTARNDTSHLDVSKDASLAALMAGSTMYSQLVRFDPSKLPDERVIGGDLAETWEVIDGQTISFKLRSGVAFHDGEPFTSADVVATMDRAREVNPLRDLLANFDNVETPDEQTAIFHMTTPVSYLLSLLAAPTTAMLPGHVLADDPAKLEASPMGTGPFMFDNWEKNVSISVKRNPNYFMEGLPYLDGATFIQVTDNAAEVNGIRTGQIHVSNQTARITTEDLEQIRRDLPDIQLRHPVCGCTDVMYMNNTRAPFDDVRVRRAIGYLIDQPRVAELLRGGSAQPGSFMFESQLPQDEIVAGIPGWDGVSDADIAEAKRLLEAAGLGDGFDVDFTRGDNFGPNFLTFYRDAFGKAGINLANDVLLKYPTEVFETLKDLDYSIGNTAAIFAMIHPTSFLAVNVTGNTENKTGYSSPEYDAMFDRLMTSVDDDEINDLSAQMERRLIEDVPWVNTSTPVYNMVLRPEVGGYPGPKFLRDYFDLGGVHLKA